MIKTIIVIFLLFSTVSCGRLNRTSTEFIVEDFSKPYKVVYRGKEEQITKLKYGVEGEIKGKIRIGEDCYYDGYNIDSIIAACDNVTTKFYTFTDTIRFGNTTSSYRKNEMKAITIIPGSGVTGKIRVYFIEYRGKSSN